MEQSKIIDTLETYHQATPESRLFVFNSPLPSSAVGFFYCGTCTAVTGSDVVHEKIKFRRKNKEINTPTVTVIASKA